VDDLKILTDMPEADTLSLTKHENNTTAKFWLFSVIPAEERHPGLRSWTRILFFLDDHDKPVFPLDCPVRKIAMYPEIGAGQ
jgi:hypothetical protein